MSKIGKIILVVAVGLALLLATLALVLNQKPAVKANLLGGLNHNAIEDFSEGISVDGTLVIDGSGNWDGAVTGTSATFSGTLGVTGATTLSSTLGVTGATTLSSTLAVTGKITGSGDALLNGTTPTLTVGDAGEEDSSIIFDGAAQDFYMALDDTADDLILGLGSAIGTTPIISLDENQLTTLAAGLTLTTGNATLTVGDTILTDGRLIVGSETGGTCSSGLAIDLATAAKGVLTTIGETDTACAISFTNGVAGEMVFLSHDYGGTGAITFADVTGFDASWTPVAATCSGIDAGVTAAANDHFYLVGVMTSATEIMITGCQYFDAA